VISLVAQSLKLCRCSRKVGNLFSSFALRCLLVKTGNNTYIHMLHLTLIYQDDVQVNGNGVTT